MSNKICGECDNWRCDEPLHLIGHCIIYRGIIPHERMCDTCIKFKMRSNFMPVNGKRYILSYEKSENDLSALVVADPEITLPNGNIKVVKILFGDYADNIFKELTEE